MAYAQTDDGVRLYYEAAGEGVPVVFVHEFAGDHRSWEAQMRYFSRRHRCIAYNARGYPPSDVPAGRRELFPGARSGRHRRRAGRGRDRAGARRRPLDGRVRDPALRPRPPRARALAGDRRHRLRRREGARGRVPDPGGSRRQRLREPGQPGVRRGLRRERRARSVPGQGPARLARDGRLAGRARPAGRRQHDARRPGAAAVALRSRGPPAPAGAADPDRRRRRGRPDASSPGSCSSARSRPRACWSCPRPGTRSTSRSPRPSTRRSPSSSPRSMPAAGCRAIPAPAPTRS